MISLIFAGTSDFSVQCLEFLLNLNYQVTMVITRPDRPHSRGLKQTGSPVRRFSEEKNLPLLTPETLSPAFLQQIAEQKCDLALVCGYGRIVPSAFFSCFSKGAVNVHPSLLPRWRGAAPIERALMAGDKKTGVCLQVMTEQLDAGDIIGQREFSIGEEETSLEIYQKALQATGELLQNTLKDYVEGRVQPIPQTGEITFADKIQKKEGLIHWDGAASRIHNQVRALASGPQAFTFFKGERLKIYRCRRISLSSFSSPGTVIESNPEELVVACGQEGALSLLELQRPGKRKQKAAEFLRGNSIAPGEVFG
ncbi:MAG: methionyl-tRNA formyltransferase [Bdellovibrionales bacterium]|nr:methionyl-tRNA formyltransferase [Bdellovibrionales bacterium]